MLENPKVSGPLFYDKRALVRFFVENIPVAI